MLATTQAMAQCKTFQLSPKGDTLNCVDQKGQKQGKWIMKVEPLRGNPGYEEIGTYKDDKKDGTWQKFNLMGDILSVENYKWGNKDGVQQYFTIAGLEREEQWRAINPADPWDTVDVVDLEDHNKFTQVRIKREGDSYEHGTWKYYQPGGILLRVEKYNMGKLGEEPGEKVMVQPADTTGMGKKDPKKMKPKEVLDFEKKYKKKKHRERTGETGG